MGHAAKLIAVVACARVAAADPRDARPVLGEVEPFWPGSFDLRIGAEYGHSSSFVADAWYAIDERFRIGVTTSHAARRELGAGRGLCIRRCTIAFAGGAADAEVRLSRTWIGRAALDFAPTGLAAELGADAVFAYGALTAELSPVLRFDIPHRDLDTALLGQLRSRVWDTGGSSIAARVAISFDAVRDTPSVGVAIGVWQELERFTLSARLGAAEVARTPATNPVFAEVAIGWAI